MHIADSKELIPEFYNGCEFLVNISEMEAENSELADVELPRWASDFHGFVKTMKDALESDYVSSQLHL